MSRRKPVGEHKRPGPKPGPRTNRRKPRVCQWCGNDYWRRSGAHGYCSAACGKVAYTAKQAAAQSADPLPQRVLRSPLCRPDEHNIHAAEWSLCDPTGTVHQFRNLAQFVREHPELFATEDTEIRYGTNSRALAGLRLLRPERRPEPKKQWKGWTWAT